MNVLKRRKTYLEGNEDINYSAKYRAKKKIERAEESKESPDDQVSYSRSSPYWFFYVIFVSGQVAANSEVARSKFSHK